MRRVQLLGGQTYPLPKRTASCDGYNLNAGVVVRAEDRAGLERLSRYILRPPLAKARIERRADGTVRLGMKRAWSDGTLAFEFSPLEFVEKLAAILPPPRKNQVIYHGVLAGNSNASGDCAETDSTARTLENALQTVKKSCSTPENSTGCASEALGRIAVPCFWSGCVCLSDVADAWHLDRKSTRLNSSHSSVSRMPSSA